MFEALISRTLDGLAHLSTLVLPTVRVRFQICGGTGAGLGVAGVPYTASVQGVTLKSDVTNADGEVEIPAVNGVVLRIFDTDYELSFVALRPVAEIRGQRQRLEAMGYFTGALGFAQRDSHAFDDIDSPMLQQGIMNFQADQGLTLDGLVGAQTQGRLTSVAGE